MSIEYKNVIYVKQKLIHTINPSWVSTNYPNLNIAQLQDFLLKHHMSLVLFTWARFKIGYFGGLDCKTLGKV